MLLAPHPARWGAQGAAGRVVKQLDIGPGESRRLLALWTARGYEGECRNPQLRQRTRACMLLRKVRRAAGQRQRGDGSATTINRSRCAAIAGGRTARRIHADHWLGWAPRRCVQRQQRRGACHTTLPDRVQGVRGSRGRSPCPCTKMITTCLTSPSCVCSTAIRKPAGCSSAQQARGGCARKAS